MYKKIINFSFNSLVEKRYLLINALAIPFSISLLVNYFILPMENLQYYVENKEFNLEVLMTLIFTIFMSIIYAVTTHRVLLLPAEELPKWGSINFGKRELDFIVQYVYLFFIGIVAGIVMVLFMSIASFVSKSFLIVSGVVGILIVLFVISRLFLVFPSIAVEKKITLKQSWEYTKNYKMITFIGIIVMPFVLTIFIQSIYTFIISLLVTNVSEHFAIFYQLLNLLITVVSIAFLSSTYKFIMEEIKIDIDVKNEKSNTFFKNEMYPNEDTYKIVFSNNIEEDFTYIKEFLVNEYSNLGFDTTISDNENSFYIKKKDDTNSYVHLYKDEDLNYAIEVLNTAKPILSFLDKY